VHRPWLGDATPAGLVRAIDNVLHPQKNLCSSGMDKRLTKSQGRSHVFVACGVQLLGHLR
jgi:hypothetical protein